MIVWRVSVPVSLVVIILVFIRQCIAAISASVATTTPSLLPAMKRALSWLSGHSAEQPADGATAWQRGKGKKKGATSSDSAEQPASIMAWLEDYRVHMESDDYKAAVEESRQKAQDHQRLSKKICKAQWLVGCGKELSQRAKNGDWEKLKQWEKIW